MIELNGRPPLVPNTYPQYLSAASGKRSTQGRFYAWRGLAYFVRLDSLGCVWEVLDD